MVSGAVLFLSSELPAVLPPRGTASGAGTTRCRTRSTSCDHTSFSTATPTDSLSVSPLASEDAPLHATNRTAPAHASTAISLLQKSGPRRADCAERSHKPRNVCLADSFTSFPRPSGRGDNVLLRCLAAAATRLEPSAPPGFTFRPDRHQFRFPLRPHIRPRPEDPVRLAQVRQSLGRPP